MDPFLSSDDNDTIYTVTNTKARNQSNTNGNDGTCDPPPSLPLPSLYDINDTNSNDQTNTINPLFKSLNINAIADVTTNNVQDDQSAAKSGDTSTSSTRIPPAITIPDVMNERSLNLGECTDLPPSLPITSRQYVRTVHELMGKDIVIPAPAIPNFEDILEPPPSLPSQTNIEIQFKVDRLDSDGDSQRDESSNDSESAPNQQQTYYDQICKVHNASNSAYAHLLAPYPKRIMGGDPEHCVVWTNTSIPSLSSFLQQKQQQRRQETDHNLQRIRMGSLHQQSHPDGINQHLSSVPAVPSNGSNPSSSTINPVANPMINPFAPNPMFNPNTNPMDYPFPKHPFSGVSNSYFDQIGGVFSQFGSGLNPFAWGEGTGAFAEFVPVPLEPTFELKDERTGRTIKLDQDILALNVAQPWAHCIVNGMCSIFPFPHEFESKRYPNGFWYAIRVHSNRVCMLSTVPLCNISLFDEWDVAMNYQELMIFVLCALSIIPITW